MPEPAPYRAAAKSRRYPARIDSGTAFIAPVMKNGLAKAAAMDRALHTADACRQRFSFFHDCALRLLLWLPPGY